jgi:hypothetical protein
MAIGPNSRESPLTFIKSAGEAKAERDKKKGGAAGRAPG